MPTVLITGTSRGIGREFVRQYAAEGWKVIAIARADNGISEGKANIEVHTLDVTDHAAVKALASTLRGQSIDVLIANAGIMGKGSSRLGSIDYDAWEEVLRVNVLAPASFAEAFVDNLASSERRLFVVISSGMGSISDNTSGGFYAYRSSKAAVNMVIKSLSIDLQKRGIRTVALCPGWVKTDMGGAGANLTPEQSIRGLRKVIDGMDDGKSGGFFNWAGKALGW